MSKEFNEWWNDNVFVKDNPFRNDSPAFWAWEGWHAGVVAEREACAKLCDAYDVADDVNSCDTAEGIAIVIRARGQE